VLALLSTAGTATPPRAQAEQTFDRLTLEFASTDQRSRYVWQSQAEHLADDGDIEYAPLWAGQSCSVVNASTQRQRSSAIWFAMPRLPWLAREGVAEPAGQELTGRLGAASAPTWYTVTRGDHANARTARAVAGNAFHSNQCWDGRRSTFSRSPSAAR
jgi:hypothetical protein